MKLAAIYNVFDGEELLLQSIEQIKPFIDDLIIIYQTTSNTGEEYNDNLAVLGQIDGLLKPYCPDMTITPQGNELLKRQYGMTLAYFRGNTHYILMDCDEFYNPDQFSNAIKLIEQNGYGTTAAPIYTYYKEPAYQLFPMEAYYVPFISELTNESGLVLNGNYPVLVDPTRRTGRIKNFHLFDKEVVAMHHYSYVRRDIKRKLYSSSARGNFGDIEEKVRLFNEFEIGGKMINFDKYSIREVDNQFGICLT